MWPWPAVPLMSVESPAGAPMATSAVPNERRAAANVPKENWLRAGRPAAREPVGKEREKLSP